MTGRRSAVFAGPADGGSRGGLSRRVRLDPDSRWSLAWLVLTGALTAHVLDEAATGFLAVYNPAVEAIREVVPWIPLPTFTFDAWLTGLLVAILALAALAPLARNGSSWMRGLSYLYGVVMALNALGHLGASLVLGRWMPGVASSPFLLAAALFLLVSVPRVPEAENRRLKSLVAPALKSEAGN